MNKTCAVVVTYNRLQLLKEVIEALLKVKEGLDKIIVVNNASTDETHDYLVDYAKKEPKLEEYLMSENLGGAGGFFHGIKYAQEQKYDYIWLMDDDSIVSPTSLKPLKEAFSKVNNLGFSCSKVIWVDGKPHQMNIPEVKRINDNNVVFFQDEGYINVNSCSFVSMLIHKDVVDKLGYPFKDFFIWCDDLEYSKRIIKNGYRGVYVEESLVTHKTASNYSASLKNCDTKEFWKIKYGYRNRTFMYRNFKEYDMMILNFLKNCKLALQRKNNRLQALWLVLTSFVKGLFFSPKQS